MIRSGRRSARRDKMKAKWNLWTGARETQSYRLNDECPELTDLRRSQYIGPSVSER
jgi:hypothetical protein